MELNTSERRINQEVLEVFENAKLKYAIEEVTKSYRYQLIKLADAAEHLGPTGFKAMVEALEPFLEKIEEGRINGGKTSGNDYIVINRDEPYINEIIKILANNGHWDGEVLGECGWCGTETHELSGPHLLDFVPGESMCRSCWDFDRESYLGSLGTDIGEFKPRGSK
ncbi:hypothetical protein [Lysinibacillus sp. NPDC096212]|uniref:hypothetical protein n=1 Tax=Lysinibacillus sp. NPDC096212 TaxID=3364135 RepID=UPI003821DD7D